MNLSIIEIKYTQNVSYTNLSYGLKIKFSYENNYNLLSIYVNKYSLLECTSKNPLILNEFSLSTQIYNIKRR